MKERTVVINGFSKNFAMAGWRLGYSLGHAEIISQTVKVHQYAIMCASTVSQYTAIEALKNGEGFIRISYAYSIDELKEALGRIENYIMHKHALIL